MIDFIERHHDVRAQGFQRRTATKIGRHGSHQFFLAVFDGDTEPSEQLHALVVIENMCMLGRAQAAQGGRQINDGWRERVHSGSLALRYAGRVKAAHISYMSGST